MRKSKFKTEKLCNRCNTTKNSYEFRSIKTGIGGWQDDKGIHRRSWCRKCEIEEFRERYKKNPIPQIKSNAKIRAKSKGVPFNLTTNYLKSIYPKNGICPVFKVKMSGKYEKRMKSNHSPSIDRIIPHKGYVEGNVIIVSDLANRIKTDATLQEISNVIKFYKKFKS